MSNLYQATFVRQGFNLASSDIPQEPTTGELHNLFTASEQHNNPAPQQPPEPTPT